MVDNTNNYVEQDTKIIEYVATHFKDFSFPDQLACLAANHEFAETLKPLYLKYAGQDATQSFIIKL